MAGFFVFFLYLFAGYYLARVVLWDKSPLLRAWLGLSFGMALLMWLPVLAAFFVKFTLVAQYIALAVLVLIVLCALWWERKHPRKVQALTEADRGMVWALVCFALPLTLLSAYLQHTHTLRDVDGALHVGQSTYGDMAMHLSLITSLRGASLPTEYNFLPGALLGYPFLTDAMGTSLYLLGMDLRLTIIIPGVVMSGLVYCGFLLLAREMTGKTSAAVIAGILLFFNGGLGFFYDFDLYRGNYYQIEEIFTGYYKTPANQPDFNLRWSNLIVDLLLPQRTFLAGWVVLLPALYFARGAFQRLERRMFLLAGLFGAMLPLIHSHSFLALGLYSAGAFFCAFFARGEKEEEFANRRKALLTGSGIFLGIVLVAAIPQLMAFTFKQATQEGFLRFHFNWVNRTFSGFVDFYPWFWAKNVGLPLLLIVCVLLECKREHRFECVGATLIFIVAELVLFQPLDYDNNKLFYVWYLLMLPAVGSLCVSLWERFRGTRSRYLIAGLFLTCSVLSGSLSVAREVVSDYQFLSANEVAAADFIEENTNMDDTFMTGMHHNNFVYTLTGRRVVCGPENFLWTHGLDYLQNKSDVNQFYIAPKENLDILSRYSVDYIVVGYPEQYAFDVDMAALEELFPIAYQNDAVTIYRFTGLN